MKRWDFPPKHLFVCPQPLCNPQSAGTAKLASVFWHLIHQGLVSCRLTEEFLAILVFLLTHSWVDSYVSAEPCRFFFLLLVGKPAALGHLHSCLFSLFVWRGRMLIDGVLIILLLVTEKWLDGQASTDYLTAYMSLNFFWNLHKKTFLA